MISFAIALLGVLILKNESRWFPGKETRARWIAIGLALLAAFVSLFESFGR